ncbi:MAG: hypothetical protein GTN62_01920 [Gemmatimonadales bacterium]|nr:hypothetical protein [Gemmatimonadales bacterium]NIN12321.1 hypothetical protein [Gemmatimonadales bacterium]NIN48859.1 hypothetical protein [Gemmatimonadales bacterium]NIP06323.1 hypothetical protein [Gemmatimonadales bacterium]NIR00695.1 hypothetical protein [Gemmatimonadales bacterium]
MIAEKAHELGRLIGQSDDYKALKRAREGLDEARELKPKLDRLQQIAEAAERQAADGNEPGKADAEEYDRLLGEIQSNSQYQQLVAAQSNFDKLMLRVQERIMEGMRKGGESSIITLD